MTHSTDGLGATPAVQLFILSRDRLDFCRETVASAVAQTYKNRQIIVSDNSEKDDVSEMLSREFPEVTVIRRKPALPALEHFNTLIGQATAPLMVLFHDDDVLEPKYVERMVILFDRYPNVAAIGSNAYIIRGRKLTREKFMGDFSGDKLIIKPFDILESYLSIETTAPAPFPGYMYRKSCIEKIKLEFEKGGKHADVSFLMEIINIKSILWVSDCLFRYRYHDGNDSSQESIGNRLSWLRYIYKTTGLSRKSRMVIDFKCIYWWRWLNQFGSLFSLNGFKLCIGSKKYRVGTHFLFFTIFRMILSRGGFWRRIFRYFKNKILIRVV